MKERSELEEGLDHLGRAMGTLAAKLLGPKAVGQETVPETPAISPEADEALVAAGETMGRLLHATGEALKAHPLDPAEAVKAVQEHAGDPVAPEPGWSPLAQGLRDFGSGLGVVAEGVLDKVAPRKSKDEAEPPPEE